MYVLTQGRGRAANLGLGILTAAALLAICFALRLALASAVGPHVPFSMYLPAVVVAAAWCGPWLGLIATLGGIALGLNTIGGGASPTDWPDLAVYVLVSSTVLVAVENLRAGRRLLHEQSERLLLLAETAGQLLTTHDLAGMIPRVFHLIAEKLKLDACLSFLHDERRQVLVLDAWVGLTEDERAQVETLRLGQGVCGAVADERRPRNVSHVQSSNDPLVATLKSWGITAYSCHPLLAGDRLIGTLAFATRQRPMFSSDEQSFFRAVCHNVAVTKERLRYEEALRQADQRKDQFLAVLAHELRNPLATISAGVELLCIPSARREQQALAKKALKVRMKQLGRMIDDLLDVSRITRDKIRLQKEYLPVGSVISRAVEATKSLIEERRHNLSVQVDESLAVEADPVRLEQIVVNLLANAAKYTNEGGRISLTARREGGRAAITVKDDGIGIAPQLQERIFDCFSQGDESLHRTGGGLGIGLSLARMLTELHGGSVSVLSEGPGRGSEFKVLLPAAACREAPLQPEEIEAAEHAPLRVLVVEDRSDIAVMTAGVFRGWGHQVDVEYDGVLGFQAAERKQYDVILLDIGLPGLDGYEVSKRLRAKGMASLIVAITGYGQEADYAQSRTAGIDHYLVKPVDYGWLMRQLPLWIRERSERPNGLVSNG